MQALIVTLFASLISVDVYALVCTVRCVGVGNFYRLPMEKVPLGPETPKTKKKIFLKGALLGRRGLKVRFFDYF